MYGTGRIVSLISKNLGRKLSAVGRSLVISFLFLFFQTKRLFCCECNWMLLNVCKGDEFHVNMHFCNTWWWRISCDNLLPPPSRVEAALFVVCIGLAARVFDQTLIKSQLSRGSVGAWPPLNTGRIGDVNSSPSSLLYLDTVLLFLFTASSYRLSTCLHPSLTRPHYLPALNTSTTIPAETHTGEEMSFRGFWPSPRGCSNLNFL